MILIGMLPYIPGFDHTRLVYPFCQIVGFNEAQNRVVLEHGGQRHNISREEFNEIFAWEW